MKDWLTKRLQAFFNKDKAVTRCIRCKRPLKDPKSIKRGYGRVCRERIKKEFIETFTSIAHQALNQ